MQIGLVTDSLGHLPLDELLETAANLGIQDPRIWVRRLVIGTPL